MIKRYILPGLLSAASFSCVGLVAQTYEIVQRVGEYISNQEPFDYERFGLLTPPCLGRTKPEKIRLTLRARNLEPYLAEYIEDGDWELAMIIYQEIAGFGICPEVE